MGVAVTLQATALVAAACRAEEASQPLPRLHDPFAELFTADLTGSAQALLAAGREEVVHRTLVIDTIVSDEVRRTPGLTVVNLGAGLCTRPYRLDLSTCREVVEVDAAATLNRKAAALAEHEPTCSVRRIDADIRDLPDLGVTGPILVVTEGLLVYLDAAELTALAGTLARLPGVLGWVADVVSADSAQAMGVTTGRVGAGLTITGLASLDPIESAGWTVTDHRLLSSTRSAAHAPPAGSAPAARRVIDGVLLLRP
ncbi:methyltransferase (TIGR00027 family) [Allocatelliglobosispora scoriae]|uniref:Methyltransferase (TIGR00027 family) n=1 Tax=Allocatelliglobosispora scoriae TaxID=643052 RepID=A0A841C231_9ACTN|nr:class I SAM-dependent methyltransferase [Allocatelliglobosispora scoriae]MBB5873030.1 methyltransferase (TIGR00027 family) [Allocatelliglobosispora scoriae]